MSDETTQAVQKFLAATGHDLCHQNRQDLAKACGLPCGEHPMLPAEAEFVERCGSYRREIYGSESTREIKAGSCWRRHTPGSPHKGELWTPTPLDDDMLELDQLGRIVFLEMWSIKDFRANFTWIADPL